MGLRQMLTDLWNSLYVRSDMLPCECVLSPTPRGNGRKMVSSLGHKDCVFCFFSCLGYGSVHNRHSVNVPRIIKFSTDLLLNICFIISTLSDPWDAKLNKTHSFTQRAHHQVGGGGWNSKHVNKALQFCEISAIKELDIKYRGKQEWSCLTKSGKSSWR